MCWSPTPNKQGTFFTPAADSLASLPGYFWHLLATSPKRFWLQRATGQAEHGEVTLKHRGVITEGKGAIRLTLLWWAVPSCRSTNTLFLNQNLIFQQEVVCEAERDSRTSTVIKACQQTNLSLMFVNKTLCRWNALERAGMYRLALFSYLSSIIGSPLFYFLGQYDAGKVLCLFPTFKRVKLVKWGLDSYSLISSTAQKKPALWLVFSFWEKGDGSVPSSCPTSSLKAHSALTKVFLTAVPTVPTLGILKSASLLLQLFLTY